MFRQYIRTIPRINVNFWSFAITGAVQRPLILSYGDLRALPARTLRCAIACAGVSKDRPLIGEADWHGAVLQALLAEVTADPAARFARLHAADGYVTVLPLERLAQTLLAYEMDGAPLPPEHGFPARLIAPGLEGYKMPKWIERIELTDSPWGGFWEQRGASLEGESRIRTAILSHDQAADGLIVLAGVAYAGERPVESVQVSIDGGGWMPVTFNQAEPFALAHWRIGWMPPGAGDYGVRVRASDRTGEGEHAVVVRVHP